MRKIILSVLAAAVLVLGQNLPGALALPTFFELQCTQCHVDDEPTCAGCHPHVANSLVAWTDGTQYAPGETVTVELRSAAFNWPGWVRAVLYDDQMSEVARLTGPSGTGDDGSGDPALRLPVLLSAPAPLTPGFYTWTVGWFGSQGRIGSEFPHVETLVTVNQFEVSDTLPSTTTTSTSTTTTLTAPSTTTTTVASTTTTTAPPPTTTTTTPPTTTTTSSTVPVTTTTTTTLQLPALDHYRLYGADGPDGPTVTMEDQFQTQVVNLSPVIFFMSPVSKNGEPILDPVPHETCYGIPQGTFAASVDVNNQFGTQQLSVGDPVALCVPTEKFPEPVPAQLLRDHYKCYQATGPPPAVSPVDLSDQFQSQLGVNVLDPFLFCNPVDKNGEGILSSNEHLTCYNTSPLGSSPGLIAMRNQLHEDNVFVFNASGLCVPSEKVSWSTTTTTGLPTTTTTVPTTTTIPSTTTTTTGGSTTTTTVVPTTTSTAGPTTTTTATPTTTTTTTLPPTTNLIPLRIGLVRFGGTPPVGRLFKIVSKAPSPPLFSLPAPGGSTDPEVTGGTVTVDMGGDELVCSLAPGAFDGTIGWRKLGNPGGSKGYKYLNRAAPSGDPCKVVLVKEKVIKVIARATGNLPVPVDVPPGNPDIGVVLTLGEAPQSKYCALALGPHLREIDGRLIKARNQAAPTECPSVPTTTTSTVPVTTSTTSVSTTVTTSTTASSTTTQTTTTVPASTTTSSTVIPTTTTTTIPPNQPPTVTAGASPRSGAIALTVDFTAVATDLDGQVTGIDWSFGDGGTDSGASVSYTYNTAGSFTAVVTATDNQGATATASVPIRALPLVTASVGQAYPTRLAEGPLGNFYVTDAKVGSVFVYDASLNPVSEVGGLDRPLGVAVDALGLVYVGNDGRDNVEVYNGGVQVAVIDDGGIQMPNDIVIDNDGNVYVVDSLSDTVKVYTSGGIWLRDIGFPGEGDGSLLFPAAATIAYPTGGGGTPELYVADQRTSLVQVFDLGGTFVRSFGGKVGAFSPNWHGLFVRLQSLAIDGAGELHAADSHACRVQILDPDTGAFQRSYGDYGAGAGEMDLPLDVLITQSGQALVADAENGRIQLLSWQVP